MGFVLKKIVSLPLQPLPIVFAVLVTGLGLRVAGRRKQGTALMSLSLVLLFLSSLNPVSGFFMYRLEHAWEPYRGDVADMGHIVVLGEYAGHDPLLPPTGWLSHASLARLAEALRLYRKNPEVKVVFSGGSFGQDLSMAEMYGQAAEALGMERQRILLFPEPRDTEDEANAVKAIVGNRPFLLVTSAEHMKRAMIIFTTFGMNPVPAPADYRVKKTGVPLSLKYYLPSATSIRMLELLIHEYLGIVWFRIKKAAD